MDKNIFNQLEHYMLQNCSEAHDRDRIYRVLYNVLDIVDHEEMIWFI